MYQKSLGRPLPSSSLMTVSITINPLHGLASFPLPFIPQHQDRVHIAASLCIRDCSLCVHLSGHPQRQSKARMRDPTCHWVGLSPTGRHGIWAGVPGDKVTQARHSLCKASPRRCPAPKGLAPNLTYQDIIPQSPPSPRDGVSGFAAHPPLPTPLSNAGVPNYT